jgi:aconitase B
MLQPHSPDNRALARECKDVKINRVYIGSCTGGKTEDFMAAAKVFLASVCIIFSYRISIILYLENEVLLNGVSDFFDNCHGQFVK